MTTNTVSVKTTRDFYDQDKREWVNAGSALEVERARAVDLRQNGLIEEFEAKAADEPENKNGIPPDNKGDQPAYKPKSKGGGKFVVVNAAGEQVGDFSGSKDEATAEAQRLIAGGEPFKAAKE